jgi:hypothetical protein
MIIKSHVRGGYRAAANYLKQQGENEKVRLVEIGDTSAKNLDEAFHNMWTVGRTTRATKPLHHVSINPYKDERLSDAQVRKICERLEEKFGYKPGDHQRVIVEHIKDGRQHFHVMWNRVSLRTGRPVWPGHHWNKSKQAAREMEMELGLKRPQPRRAQSRANRSRSKLPAWPPLTISRPYPIASRALQPALPKLAKPRRPHQVSFVMKSDGMNEEQRVDYIAACDGKITWKQYFLKWGRSLSL